MSLAPEFAVVKSVLITFLGSLNKEIFFSVSLSLANLSDSKTRVSNSFALFASVPSSKIWLFYSAEPASVPSSRINESVALAPEGSSRTRSALKS